VNSNFFIHKIFLELNIPNKILKIPFKSDEIKNKEISDFYNNYTPHQFPEFSDKTGTNFHNKNRFAFPFYKGKTHLNKKQFEVPFYQNLDPTKHVNINKMPLVETNHKQRFDVGVNQMLYNNFFLQQQLISYNYAHYNNMHHNIYRMNEKKNITLTQKQMNTINLIQLNEGGCNFTLFLKSVKPYVLRTERESYRRLSLMSFFNSFEKTSIFGLDVMYFIESTLLNDNRQSSECKLHSNSFFNGDNYKPSYLG